MPQSDTGAGSHYPLASGSGSRRRLLLFGLTGAPIEEPANEEDNSTGQLSLVFDEPDGPVDSGSQAAIADLDQNDSGELPSPVEKRPSFGPVQQLLVGAKPLTWVFTGDSVTAGHRLDIDRRNFVELFAARLRGRRPVDVVINTAVPGEGVGGLLEDLEWRSLRFRPDVVVLMPGIDDAAAGPTSSDVFRDRVLRLVECIRSDGAIPVLQTPHRTLEDSPIDMSALRTQVKAIRQIAGQADVPCVDHWGRWKRKKSDGVPMEGWLSSEGVHPSTAGHRQLADLICACFGLQESRQAVETT